MLAFYLLLASTVYAQREGDLGTPADWAAVAGAGLVTRGLAVVALRGLRARDAVRRALEEGLGAGWRSTMDARLAGRLRRRLWYGRILFAPIPLRPPEVARGEEPPLRRRWAAQPARRLSSPEPAGQRPRPDLFPRGSYFSGGKSREAKPLLHRLAGQGWVCVSANYRLRPSASFPDHLIDAKQVIAWVRAHAPEYGADPGTVVVAGSSAGGHLATLCAFAYPATQAPPIFMAHGDRDTLVPVSEARLLATRLRSVSTNPVVYAELAGGHHAFDLFHKKGRFMTPTTTSRASRNRPWATIAGAAGAALAVWVVSVPVAGVDLAVGSGPSRQTVGPAAVAVVSLLAGGAAWALLAFLERRFRSGRRAWQITASVVLALSLLGPVSMGATGAVLATLVAMHVVVGMALILGLPRRKR